MGMGASGVLGFGILLDEEACSQIGEILEVEDPEGWEKAEEYIGEYFYDSPEGLDFVSWGYCDLEQYLVCVKGYAHNTCTWDSKVITELKNPEDTCALDNFCDKFNLKKDYAWRLGSYYG